MFTGSWTPNPQSDNQTNSFRNYELQSRRSKSVGRSVESQNILERSYYPFSESINRKSEEWELRLGSVKSCYPSLSSPHYITNCFAQQRSKTQHFHLPPYRFQQKCKRGVKSSTPPVLTTFPSKCLYCGLPCHSLLWSEIEYLCKTLDKKGIHRKESFTEQLAKLVKSTAIGELSDQSIMDLQSLVDCLEACRNNSINNSRNRSYSISPTSLSTPNCYCIHKHLINLATTICSSSNTSSGVYFFLFS